MADNRYYYFKDAKGNRHTVDKTAYDKDPMGFAKAFPGARMEVIDRKTGRRGDVSVKDASRVGDFGAHLFTGRTITRGKGNPNSSALGRAQQSVAQEKWGGGVVTHENTTASENVSAPKRNAVTLDDWNGGTTGKESELVKGLRAADMIRKRDEEQMPIDYTKPGAVKQMVGGARRAQKSLERRMEQAGQEAGRNAEGEIRRRNAPAFDLGNEDVNNNIVKTRGQLEDELEESSRQLVDKQLGGYVSKSIEDVFKDAETRGLAAATTVRRFTPYADIAAGKVYNEALDPDKLMNQLSKNAEKDMTGLFSDPKMRKEIAEKAASFGIDPEDYVKNYIAPGLQAKIAEEFEKSELSRNMPKSTAEYIIRGVNDSMIGTILSMGMMSKKQRQYAQQGMAMTDNGENPYVKPGMGARVARGTLSFVADAPAFGAAGKAGAAVAGKAFGNGVAQAARIANTSLAGRIGRMVGTGAVSQGVTGVLYGSTNAAVQNYSTGDDTSIGNTVKLMTMGGLSEGASWATMGGIGGAVGAGIYNVSGVKRIPAKVFQIAMEGVGMHMGGNVAKMIEGHDTDWLSVEGNLEACANVVALKLTHARLPKRQVMDGKKEGYLDMVARNIKNLMTSDGQRAAFGGYTFTNEEKEQLFGSDKAPKREETLYGYDVHDNPLTRKESLTSWAMRTKKTAAKGKGEESYKDTDTEFVKTAYDEIMADETIPWDTKAKFSALVMGTVPSARPMMDHIAIECDERGAYVGEYSLYGELLSKNRYKTADEYVSIKYNLGAKKENQRLSNAYGAAQIKDEKAAQETLETVAETFGFTAEQLKAAMDKDPLKRSEEEQNACVALRKAYEGEQFPEGTLHPEQSQTEGKDVVEENNLGTENPNNEAVAEVLNNMNNAEKAFNAALESNDVLKQEYERLTKEGLSEPQIYMELFNSGLTQEQLAPFADYINAKAKAVGMYRGTEQKIAETVQKHVEQWSYKGELDGVKQDGGQMLFVKDNNGRLLIVGAGDVAFDSEGRARESVGDMISVLDPNTKEMDFVSKKDVQLDHVEKTEDYAKNYQEMLEVMNSEVYAQNEQQKQMENAAGGVSPEGGKPNGEEGVKHSYTLGEKKAGNGEPFYQDESGNIDLATIPDEVFEGIGYTKAPFRLTPSMIKHMLDRHNKELGFKDEGEAINFVVDVMNNFDHVRLGYDGALVFSIENGRKRTGKRAVTVLINSDNGEFYGLKTSGYEGIKGLEKRPLLWERGANETSSTDAASASVTTSKGPISGGQSGSASHQGNGLHDKDSNNSPNGNGNKETLTFADGSPVPMKKDSNGRETADYSQMTPEQGAEWMSSQFGENAEAAVDGQIKRAEKILKEAEKIKVDYTGDLNDAKEAEAQKAKAVDAAKAELELYTNIKKVMTANKIKAGIEKVGAVGEEGSVSEAGNLGAVREKFESGKRIVGNKRTRTLADGSKLRGHYEIVEADSLTPSHNANDGYKKSEGFPVNEEGRTINDRDYENDKQAQMVTDMIAMKYDGQAVDQVPVVTSDGIVVDGNGRTMAGQKAAKDGTDGAYLEALKENAENYGFTAEQIEQSGIKHPRLVLVSDEPMKYDTATFAKFNMNEKKSQGNTQQAVANSKKLSTDEISVIMSEIEGSGSLDAFFNNSTAINSLLKRLIDKGVIGLNEVAGLREGEDRLSASGKDFVKNLLLGSVFSENTIRMMGADAMLKTKALNGIRAVTDNMKLGDYALMKEIDQAVQLLYEARQGGSGVDAYLRTPAMFGENAADRYDPISQAIALALEGKVEDFRELMMAYNRNAAPYADANQTEMFGERPTKEDFVNEFLKLRNWKDYETRHSSKEGNGDAGSSEGTEPQAPGGNVITSETDYNKAVEQLKEAKGEERERILDQMGEYVKEFAKSNGYDEPVVLRTKQDLADAAKTENDKTIIENMPEGAHYPGYYEDGKIHIYLEGSTGSEELRETFEHESVHADNEVDPSRVEALVYSITDMNTLTREELERVVEVLSNMKEYTERASEMNDVDALYMLADEALAHLVTYAQEHGKDAMSEITDNPTLLNIAEKSLKERENDRRRKEGLAKSGDKTLERKNLDDVSTEENGGALEGDKEGKPENDNGGSPDRDIQAGEEQREVDKAEEEKSDKPSEASLGLTKSGEQPGEKSEGAKPVGDGKEPKANPLDGMRKAAELFKDEQITKARAELAEAKKSGDASEVKRLTDKLKGLMDSTLRGKGIGLVERRKIIGEELGKEEAEKIDKPWADMEFDEQVAETEKKPLDADEIKNSDCDGVDKANAVAYLNGDKNIINTLSYLTVYDNVRNRERDSVPSSGTEDGTQLDAADNAGGEGLGRTDSRPQGVDSGQLGGSEGDGNPERGESVQSGERVSGGESGKVHAATAVGERGGEQVHGGASRVEPVSTGGTKPRGSRGVRGTGRDVRERGNEGSGNFSDEKAGEATGGRGIDSRNLSTVEQIDKEISDTQSLVDDLFNSLFDGRTKGSIISDRTNASIIPLASDHLLGKLGINKQKMAVYKQLIPALTKLGYLHIKKGVVKLNDWIDAMKGSFGGHLTKLGLSDEEVYDYIKNMWNSNIEVDGVTHKLSEWASILGTERMKKEIATPNAEKYKRQVAAEPIKVKVGDIKNIEETLPYLLPQQQEDVLRAETQFFGKEHADREHAYGKGYMFTNGTGTGKTFTGLGVAKRLVKQGKGRILIVTPSQKKVSDWIKDGRNLNMEIRDLDSIAKERGTTATTESGEGVVITTFANFGVNKKLLETKWDAVIYDESHRIMENKNGTETARSMQHYMVTNRSENHCFLRLQETNKDYQKMKSLGERFDAERGKEVKRIQDEYKASHPSATPRDVTYATSRMLPKERNGFTPGDYASFPKLGKIHGEFVKALSHYTNEVEPKLKAQAKAEWKDTKTIFLSATPFNTRENLDYAEGYIFKYPEVEKGGRISGRTQFYLDHFGAAYKFRYNRLEQSTSNPEAVAKQEIAFSDYLQHTLGTMSGRIIDSPYDYSRDFPTVSPDHAETFNQAVQDAVRGHEVLAKAYNQTIGDYNYGSALFETMKVANIIERIKAHLDAGRKVVIFHRRVETKEPLKPPFASMLEQANRLIAMMKPGEEQKKAIQAVKDFRKKYADLLEWEQTLDYSMPREQIAKVFGKDKVLFFSGKESTKVKDKAVDTFNSDDSGKNIIVIQEASGKEGISLHDTTGKHQRVCITLALPQSPITALQIEGRTYRIGNKSNAIFEYPILGLNSEMMLFGQKFNNQVSTTENLALGSQARSLRDSFANGILEHSGVVPIDQQGVGGKEFDAPKDQSTDGFDNAVLDYYSNQKLNSRNREGVDYFPTPEPLGYKMMEWANMGEGDTVMEPSAGHGAIARYAPKGNQMVAIEPSQSLFAKLQLKAGGLGRKFVNTIFENYDISNKHDVVVMNPPFGTAGATAIAHLGKAFKHLEEGGRVVALIPRGSTDKKFEKWIEGEKTAVMRAEVELPDILFEQAGTRVVCRVVVVDKISNEAMRAKAGSVEKVNLGGHYDKIEDFFEDLRDVEMPDRIIDTNTIMMKKSKQTVKDLKELKDARVDFNEGGINVRVRGDWKDYFVPFFDEGYTAEQKKKTLASQYETLEQQERQTRNETSQAVIAELKKLTCKLAGMTEEEMQRYLKKKYEGKGVMYRVEHAAEVYNKAKGGGSKGQRDGRVVPEDVDKKTSEGIEKKFDEEIGEVESYFDSKEEFMQAVSKEIHLASRYRKSVLENKKKQLENELRRKESNTGENSERAGTGRLASVNADNKTSLQGHRDKVRGRIALAAINRELDYRRVRAENLRNTYGLSAGSEIGFGEVEKIFRQLHTSPELGKLFAQTRDVLKRLGVDFGIQDEINSGKLTSPMGYASPERDIRYSIDGLVKTSSSKAELPVTILHEMIHEGVNGAIHLVKSGKADGMLTPKQIEAVETISEIYDRAVGNQEKFRENNYGLEDEYEFAAQMADPRQRKALDLGVMDRVVNFAKELMRKGDRSVWERVKDAVKKLFEVSDKSKMDKAIEDILEDFNKTVDDAAMVDVDENGWSYDKGVVTPEKTSGTSNAVSERIIKTVEKVAKRTGGKVKMVNSVEEIENPKVRKDIENGKQVTGWNDEKTGEVHLYMPNIHDTYTAEKTVWHETVGHKGMRGLLGDKFDSYMRDLWMDLDNPINAELRAYVKEKMNMNHLGFYDAIEEFIAKSAEDGKGEPEFWNYIKNKVTDALHEIGYRVSPNVKDVKYMLWLAKNVQKHGDSPLWKMRAEAVRWKIEHEKTLSVVEENGMMYDNNGKKHGLLDLNKKDFDEATDGHVHYRTSPMTASKIEEYNRRLSTKWYAFKESTVDDMQSLQEAMQIISGVKDAYADIPSAFNPLQCHNRMGSMVMQMCERYDREYTEPLGDAFKKVVSAMPGKDGAEQTRNANLYFIKKHGLERNRVLFVRDKIREERKVKSEESDSIDALETAWKGERSDLRRALDSGQIDLREYYRQMDEWIVQNLDKDFKAEEHDYSGMHGIYDVKKGDEYDDANVIDEVMSTESQLGADLVKSFWDAKKKATDFTIDQEYANGFKDKNERDHLKEMFDWYVPLRKFDDTVAEDVYGYISGDDTKNDIGSVIEKARGRESLSDVNVLAQISALAKSSILNGGKNVEKQHFMRFVEAYEKGDAKDRIFVEIQPWVEKHTVDGNEVWEEVMPNIPENSTQEQINEILNTFEATMKAKQANGEAKIARRKSDIGYKFERSSDMNQHIVNVYVNGRVRRFVCQGNPRAAQAINGMLRDSGTRGWVSEKSAELNRYCAQLNTSLNPDFLSSNLMRDLTFVSANLTKEGMGYTWDFCMEYAKNWASMARRKDGNFDGGYLGMFRRYKDGRLDANNQKERWFKEFMDNGGETGFVSLKKYEDIIKEYENLVKTGNKEGDRWLMKKLKEGGALIELANEVVENVARYSTYCVSRKRGRSIGKSIYDAKEVSSNFNRHGSGDAIKSLKTEYDGKTDIAFRNSLGWFNSYMKNHTMFYNAGVQGANLFTKNLKHAPKTAAIAFGAMPFGLNIAVALLNQLLISQEDEKKRNGVKNPYAELPEWKRRNNLCIYWGGGKFKTIPMGIELRAFYGLGDIAAGYMVDESLKSDTPIGLDIIGQMAQLVPASDFLGHHSPSSGIKELGEDVILSVIPTTAKPELELAFNRDWTGRPIYRDNDYLNKAPRWKRAYDSTNDAYMTINKWANKTFNGIDNTNEGLKGSGMLADAVDFFTAPYGLQHIVEGYTGGAGATIGRMYQTGKSFAKGVVSGIKDDKGFAEGFNKEWDKVDPNTIPFYRVFNYTPKEGNDMQRTKSKWYNYADELEQLKYNMQQMKTNTPDTAKNIHNAASKFKVSQSKEGRMLKIYEAADRYITAKRRILKRAKDKAVVEAVNEAINRKMQEAVEDLDRIE